MKELIRKYLKYLKIERNSSEHTITSYQNDLNQLLNFASRHLELDQDSIDISELDRLMIRLWLGELTEEGMARNTIARKVAAVRSFFKYCFKRGYISKNPAHLLIVPKKERRLPKTIQTGEISEMMELANENDPTIIQERAILELFYATGIRLSELTNLNVKDIQIPQKQLTVFGKGNKQRIVPLGEKALDAIKNHLQYRSELFTSATTNNDRNALFLSVGGKRIYPRMVQRIIKKYLLKVSEELRKVHIRSATVLQLICWMPEQIFGSLKNFLGMRISHQPKYIHTQV